MKFFDAADLGVESLEGEFAAALMDLAEYGVTFAAKFCDVRSVVVLDTESELTLLFGQCCERGVDVSAGTALRGEANS